MGKLKNWKKFNEEIDYDSLDDNKKRFIDSLSDEKGRFLLVILLKGNEDDLMMLYEQVQDFHDLHPDMTRTATPYTLYYSTDWWIKEKGWTIAKMRDVIQKEANNIGLNVRIVTWSMSEKDFELERDLPPKFRVMDKSKNSFKKMNEGFFGGDEYLITYEILNRKAELDDNGMERDLESWKSGVYNYIIKASSKEDAKNKFSREWDKKTGYPKPRLEILNIMSLKEVKNEEIKTF